MRRHANLRPVAVAVLLLALPGPSARPATLPGAPAVDGVPPLVHYGSSEYGRHPQNWAVAQGRSGVMWFGNTDGVLSFDGERWDLVPLPNGSIVRSLAVADDGTVWVGGVGELGYLQPVEPERRSGSAAPARSGRLELHSLLDRVPPAYGDLADVWRTYATPRGVFFQAGSRTLLRWSDGAFRAWPLAGHRQFVLEADGRILFNQDGAGLVELVDEELRPVPGGGDVEGHLLVAALPASGGDLLLVTRRHGLLRFRAGRGAEPWPTEADADLRAHGVYHAHRFADGTVVLTTMSGGAFAVDGEGRLLHRLDRASGLPDDSAWFAAGDSEGGLWLALDRGLVRVDLRSPCVALRAPDTTVEDLSLHDGVLHAATRVGVTALRNGHFEPVEGADGPAWSLLEFREPGAAGNPRLLAGDNLGVLDLSVRPPRRIAEATDVYALAQSRSDPARLLIGSRSGLTTLRFEDGSWRPDGPGHAVGGEVRSLAEDSRGRLWLGTFLDAVYRLDLAVGRPWRIREVTHYGVDDGLPTPKSVKLLAVGDEVLAATAKGLHRYDEAVERFVPDPRLRLPAASGEVPSILRIARGGDGDLWLGLAEAGGGTPAVARRREDGSYRLSVRPFRGLDLGAPLAILVDGSAVWLGGVGGVVRCRTDGGTPPRDPYPVLIREAAVRRAGGWAPLPAELPYGRHTLRFRFAAPRFTAPPDNRYRLLLEGFDEGWSAWTAESTKEYNGLPPGRYRLRVRARDAFGDLSREASLRFHVLAPWYLNGWAFALYGMLAVVAVGAVVRLRSRHLERENQRLEAEVGRRTAELAESVRELQAATEELEAFSYSVSHDLEAPLRRIRSFSELLLAEHDDQLDDDGRDYLRRIASNARDLRSQAEALLALSRVGRGELDRRPLDLSSMAAAILAELGDGSPEREVEVRIEPGLEARADRHLVELLLRNLLDNAWKFTRPVEAAVIEVERVPRRGGADRFRVRDNGVGFDPRYADRLFIPFRRLHDPEAFEGSGVGLATVQRIVRRHGGTMRAEGAPGAGASFTFSLEPDPPSR